MLGFRHHPKATTKQCAHTKALPRWDRIEDSGNLERVSGYYCPECDQFLPASQPDAAAPSAPHD